MKITLVTLALVAGSAFQINAQITHYKGDITFTSPPSEITNQNRGANITSNPIFRNRTEETPDNSTAILVRDMTGKVVKTVQPGEDPFSTSGLRAGSYSVCFYSRGTVTKRHLEVM